MIRQTGKLEASNFRTTGGRVPGGSLRKSAIARFEMLAEISVRIGPRLEIDFDQANARQRARLNVIDSATQGEESFEADR